MSIRALLLCPALLLAACGGENPSSPAPAADDTGTTDETAVEDTGAVDEAAVDAPAPPITPRVYSVAIMGSNLHVSWKLNDTGLSKVYLLRKKNDGEYAIAYTLSGKATNIHDSGAYAPGKFCYRVQTERSGLKSELSNEMCRTL
ncbi:MAG: hypothetical protein HYV09_34775 [Deltaproteobacteria bacterium]|nr:hypothetical protein [Deltaproteobacteria bacterium]